MRNSQAIQPLGMCNNELKNVKKTVPSHPPIATFPVRPLSLFAFWSFGPQSPDRHTCPPGRTKSLKSQVLKSPSTPLDPTAPSPFRRFGVFPWPLQPSSLFRRSVACAPFPPPQSPNHHIAIARSPNLIHADPRPTRPANFGVSTFRRFRVCYNFLPICRFDFSTE